MTTQVRIAIVVAVAFVWLSQQQPPQPPPPPAPVSALNLRGLFVGESASADAVLLGALCEEIADEIEHDGRQDAPLLATGVAIDTLRTRARIARMRGSSIGDRQPRVRDAVAAHLDKVVGTDGGPVDAEARAEWVQAYREIAEACANAISG